MARWGPKAAISPTATVFALVAACAFIGSGCGDGRAPGTPDADSSPDATLDAWIEAAAEVDAGGDAGAGADARPDCGASAGSACVEVPPSGWTLVAAWLGPSPPPCPARFGPPTDLVVAGGPAKCNCACDGGTSGCTGDVTVLYGSNGSCDAGSLSLPGTSCASLTQLVPLTRSSWIQVERPDAQPSSCTPSPTISITPEGVARTCPASTVAAECPQFSECIGDPQSFRMCIMHDGAEPCPALFYPDRFDVGSSIQDSRACTPCSCTAAATCDGQLTIYEDGACYGAPQSFDAGDPCGPINGIDPRGSTWTPSPSDVCVPSGGTTMGSEAFTGRKTLCCR